MEQDINKVKFSDETVKFIHDLIAKAIRRAIKEGRYVPRQRNS